MAGQISASSSAKASNGAAWITLLRSAGAALTTKAHRQLGMQLAATKHVRQRWTWAHQLDAA